MKLQYKIKKRETVKQRGRPKVTEKRFMRALKDSGGNKHIIAEKLNVSYSYVHNIIKTKFDQWLDAKELYETELESVGDIAQQTIKEVMTQRVDLGSASRTARWYLEKTNKEFVNKQELKIEGGKTPLQVNNNNTVSLDALNLPLEVRKEILKAMEKKEAEERADEET